MRFKLEKEWQQDEWDKFQFGDYSLIAQEINSKDLVFMLTKDMSKGEIERFESLVHSGDVNVRSVVANNSIGIGLLVFRYEDDSLITKQFNFGKETE